MSYMTDEIREISKDVSSSSNTVRCRKNDSFITIQHQ